MASDQPTTDPFLAAIEAKIAAWTAVADTYRAAVALDGPLGELGAGTSQAGYKRNAPGAASMDLPVGVFRDKGLKEAIEIYLAAGRRKQTNKEIAIGLQKGGIATTAANFEATVATALGRMKDDGTVLRFPDGWDLASSYPDSLRTRLEKDTTPKKTAKKAKRGKRPAGTAPKATTADNAVKTGPRAIRVRPQGEEVAS